MIRRVYVEKRPAFRQETERLLASVRRDLGLKGLTGLRHLLRYDVEAVEAAVWEQALATLFAEPAVERLYEVPPWESTETVFAVEYLPGQFDQRADSAEQCLRLLGAANPVVRCAEVTLCEGEMDVHQLEALKAYRINPVDSREAALGMPESLQPEIPEPRPVARLDGFREGDAAFLADLHQRLGLAMSLADLGFCQTWFRETADRDPSLTEIKLLDTYWSDHCRHTTFLTELTRVDIEPGPLSAPIEAAWKAYLEARKQVYCAGELARRPPCLMDLALMGMKVLRAEGKLEALEVSEEVNAASIVVPVEVDGEIEEWLVMFKNETHNHPTEIEPFGGAATCLGGAIRDPLSGRSYVYQAMRVTGSGDPRQPVAETLPGKLPQRKITLEAAHGYSSYGNQIGLATGCVHEVYHQGYVAKRMEIGAVIAAAPRSQVIRGEPAPGDVIVLVGGRTGRDGIGGATGSSKAHSETALENAAEVQKGDPPTERKLQRLFRHPDVSRRIKRCNDFGAGGISVAIGELAPGLEVNLDAVPLKYAGLDGTEIALSESQERMAVVLDPVDLFDFLEAAAEENLEAVAVAKVTAEPRLRMRWRGDLLVDISRDFLDSNGVRQEAEAFIAAPAAKPPAPRTEIAAAEGADGLPWEALLSDLAVCSQKGLVERFDSSIGAASILHPFGGARRMTPAEAMAAKIPVLKGDTRTATLMSFGFDPERACWSPFHGAAYAVVEAVARIVASGGTLKDCWLTLQEYFPKTGEDPRRWGLPLAALLGAWTAQRALGIAAIGGKDSMSGTFKDLDVPPTLVAFAVCPVASHRVLSPELKQAGSCLARLRSPLKEDGLPDWDALVSAYGCLTSLEARKAVLAAAVIRKGGLAAAIARMSFGNTIGFVFKEELTSEELTASGFGDLVLEVTSAEAAVNLGLEVVGQTQEAPFAVHRMQKVGLDDLQRFWEQPLESVFPTAAPTTGGPPHHHLFEPHRKRSCKLPCARPRVLLPVFPGTNCEYDTARAFVEAGAEPEILVLRNRTHSEIRDSLEALEAKLRQVQMLMLSGGFSAGDEPGGSGKFIASVFRHERIAEATRQLYQDRDGLILGICNGFQALVKLGLLPYGKIQPMAEDHPSLTVNHIGRHVSCYVRTKVTSRLSPWLSLCPLGAEYMIPVSHGEGRFVGPEPVLLDLFQHDQVACQYVDAGGRPTLDLPENPNGSMHAIEGITSPCGRILGKMGHSERSGPYVGINVPGDKEQPIFASGVAYFQ